MYSLGNKFYLYMVKSFVLNQQSQQRLKQESKYNVVTNYYLLYELFLRQK